MTEPTDPTTAADVDPQTAADAAERVQRWLDEWSFKVQSNLVVTGCGRAEPDGCTELTAPDIDALLADRARLAAELEQVRGQRDRQQRSAAFWRRRAFQLADLIPAEQIPDPEWDDSDESQLAERNEELRAAVTEAAGLIDRLADDDECEIDHHGYCQTHNLHSAPCPHPLGRRFVEAWGAGQGNAQPPVGPQDAPQGP